MSTSRVAIVGAGIGGLSAAIALRQHGFDVRLYERAAELKEVGAGLTITPNGSRVLHHLGLGEALDGISSSAETQYMCDYESAKVFFRRPGSQKIFERYGMPQYQVHRNELLKILLEAVPSACIELNKSCVGVSQDANKAKISFADGSSVEADIVIGADGIRSRVRSAIVPDAEVRFLKRACYRTLVPVTSLPEGYFSPDVAFWVANNGHIVSFYVSGGRNINIVGIFDEENWTNEAWSVPSSSSEFLDAFPNLHEKMASVIKAAPEVLKWCVFDLKPLDRWSDGRITIMGDAAHAMFPMHSQGGNMAIEDGYALAAWINEKKDDPVAALANYEANRRPRTTRQQHFALKELKGMEELFSNLRNAGPDFELPTPSDIGWLYDYDVASQWMEIEQ